MSKTDTCLAVVAALDERMRRVSIERVKVVDLCRDAGISRATFYEYFQDVFAVATWMWDHLMETTLYRMGSTLDCYTAHLRRFRGSSSARLAARSRRTRCCGSSSSTPAPST